MLRVISLTLAASVVSAGCATITRGTTEIFVVETSPSGAKAQLSNGMVCEATPCSFKVSRNDNFVVTLSKEGYKTTTHSILTEIGGGGGTAMAGNVILGGIVGAGLDAMTGAMLEHKPNPLRVEMERITNSAPEQTSDKRSPQGLPPPERRDGILHYNAPGS